MLLVIGLLGAQLVTCGPLSWVQEKGAGQDAQNTRLALDRARKDELRVYSLRHVRCEDVAEIVNSVLHGKYAHPESQTNRIIFGGPTECAKMVAQIIEKVDVAPDEQESVQRVFPISFASSKNVAGILEMMLGARYAHPETATNSIIYSGPTKHLSMVEKVLEALDVAPEPARKQSKLVIVPVKHRGVDDLARRLKSAMLGSSINIAPDRARSTIVLNGAGATVEKALSMIEKLDLPAASVNLEFAFFKATLNLPPGSGLIPKDLQEVAGELQRFGRIELLGRLSTMSVEGEEFKVSGNVADSIFAEVQGRLIRASADGSVNVHLNAEMGQHKFVAFEPKADEKKASRQRISSEFNLETAVSTQRGDYVVLGSAPSGWEPGEAAILVLHVRP